MIPKREIMSPLDMDKWKKSTCFNEYNEFINKLNHEAINTKLTDDFEISETVQRFLDLLSKLSQWIDEIPPIQQPQRFGNKAFKTWLDKVKHNSKELLKECFQNEEAYIKYADEISVYLNESFGNDTRIDYGTGHEMAFLMLIMCLCKIGIFKSEDLKTVSVKVFNDYIKLARKLQVVYKLEPAGSHGVWSLDDFQFLPFVFGSAQLSKQFKIEPKNFVEQDYIDLYQDEYMFFQALKYITTVKSGPFAEHSNQLWNISSVQLWSKVNSGLIKMYNAEVLLKFPVVQHILFGDLIRISPK